MTAFCLTGDLHHMALGTGNQRHADRTEIQIARSFLELLEAANVKVTFYVSGRAFVDEWADLEPIARHPLVELGGHNWNCLEPALVHRVSKKLLGSYNGPPWLQRWDAARTIRVIEERTGKRIRAWRNHMYMHGPNTERVLAAEGLEVCADGARKDSPGPEWHADGLYNFPINVIPDHEHIFHAERTREWVAAWRARYAWSDDWGGDSYDMREWVDIVLADLARNRANGVTSHLIIHPITMYLADRFDGFRRILEVLAQGESLHTSEVIARKRGMP